MAKDNIERLYVQIREDIKAVSVIAGVSLLLFILTALSACFSFQTAWQFGFGFFGGLFCFCVGRLAKIKAYERTLANLDTSEPAVEVPTVEPEVKPVDAAVTNVQIPAEPKLPDIPSSGAPAEVKEILKASKAKAKSTVAVPPSEPAPTVPETKKVVMKRKAK